MIEFGRLIEALSTNSVDFVLVGGVAATLHGSARLTQDMDIVYSRTPENLKRLSRALLPLHPYLREAPPGLPFQLDVETLAAGLNFTLSTAAGDVDLLGEIAGVGDYEALSAKTIAVRIYGHPCRCIDLPTLIAAKIAAGRPKDLEAVAELRAILEERSQKK